MAILAGIDEAGYGPLLGPLVVSGVAFSIPQNLLKADLWQVLQKAVSKDKKKLSGRLLVNDSKKAYSRSSGTHHLQRTVLAALDILNRSDPSRPSLPQTTQDVIKRLSPSCYHHLSEYPWYQKLDQTALPATEDISIASGVFQRTLVQNQMRLLWVQTRFLEAGHYNQQLGKIKNKSRVLFIELCALVHHIFKNFHDGDGPMQFLIDRQGGRIQYHLELMKMFPGMELTVLTQSDTLSSYEMTDGKQSMRLHFAIEADSKFLPVSLASMASKWTRELLMEELNRYFVGICPGIKPTAGYWQDGQRFIADLHKIPLGQTLDKTKLIRLK
jgi:ribonuclease HII